VSIARSGNEMALLIDYNQTGWDLYVYQIRVIDVTGMIISTVNTSDPAITIPINRHFWTIEVVTHTRCLQESIPQSIDLWATSSDSEVDNNSSTIGTKVSTESPPVIFCNGNN
jgi:hypothetical protein